MRAVFCTVLATLALASGDEPARRGTGKLSQQSEVSCLCQHMHARTRTRWWASVLWLCVRLSTKRWSPRVVQGPGPKGSSTAEPHARSGMTGGQPSPYVPTGTAPPSVPEPGLAAKLKAEATEKALKRVHEHHAKLQLSPEQFEERFSSRVLNSASGLTVEQVFAQLDVDAGACAATLSSPLLLPNCPRTQKLSA